MIQCSVLSAHREAFEGAVERVRALLDGLDSATANRQPQPGSWSTLQALEHLNVGARIYHPRIERALAEAGPGGPPYVNGTLTGRLILDQLQPKKGKRLKAPKIFRPPTTSLTVVRVLDDFQRDHDTWIRLLRDADGKDLSNPRVRLPLPIPIHISLAQAFELHATHVPRHVAQAERAAHHVRTAAA